MAKRYLIVGANSTIAQALITQLLHNQNEVITFSRTAIDIPNTTHYEMNLTDPDISFPTIEGPLHGIVYFPGTITLGGFENLTLNQFEQDYAINVLGAVKVLRQYLSLLKENYPASVVLISSVAASVGMPMHASIASAKAAIEGLMRSLAAEYAPKVRFNAVAPSLTNTSLAESLLQTEEKIQKAGNRHPLKRVGEKEDISHMIEFLLSDQASWVTGQVFGVDGGLGKLYQLGS